MTKKEPLISIVIPVYNAERFLTETIRSIQNQSYTNWEAIFVDDKSSDNSLSILRKYAKADPRIKIIELSQNLGTAKARNAGINKISGRYLCFQDADDLWAKNKLEKQLDFMRKKNCAFSYTGYEFANEKGEPNGKKVFVPESLTYKQALKNTTITTISVMFDMTRLNLKDVTMPNVRSEDTATWWNVLKKVHQAYGLNEILAYYRRSANTRSANKIHAISKIWELYRKQEALTLFYSFYNFCFYAINAVRRRI